jgi:hypothetical protein
VNQGLFLVANIGCTALDEDLGWLCDDETPYEATDPLDFLQGDEIAAVYELYESLYRDIDQKLNIQMPEALLEFNRWIIFRDDTEAVVAFACFKTTEAGLKLGVAATNGQESGKSALIDAAQARADSRGGLRRSLGRGRACGLRARAGSPSVSSQSRSGQSRHSRGRRSAL